VDRVEVAHGIELAYELVGSGPSIICIHGALMADSFGPLVAESALGEFRRITYYRRGYGDSSPLPSTGITMAQQAADCAALLRRLGVPHAHVVGHSLGGSIALQLALDAPELVHTLVLLEPGLFLGGTAAQYRAALTDNQQRFRELGAEVMVEEFFRPRFGADWRARFEREHADLVAQAIAHATTFFEHEITGLAGWAFGEADLRRIRQPVLAVLGAISDTLWDRFGETHRMLLRALPIAQGYVLPGATHAMQLDNAHDLGLAIADFCRRMGPTTHA
jgi:pimeloyl-ACP methyl ester carboxylesterase